uniref:C-type lectin domain-containing protein n=1 Tax=Acrobeloides nanus TaxID=290746 RepID=A0A914DHK5_9BILA
MFRDYLCERKQDYTNVLDTDCPEGWLIYRYSCYKVLRDKSYAEAVSECKNNRASLATISDWSEARFLAEKIRSNECVDELALVGLRAWHKADAILLINEANNTYISDIECLTDYKGDILTEDRRFYCTPFTCTWFCRLPRSFYLVFNGKARWQEIIIVILSLIFIATLLIICLAYKLMTSSRYHNTIRRTSISLNIILSSPGPNMSRLRIITANELILDMDLKHKLGEGEFGTVYANYIKHYFYVGQQTQVQDQHLAN